MANFTLIKINCYERELQSSYESQNLKLLIFPMELNVIRTPFNKHSENNQEHVHTQLIC